MMSERFIHLELFIQAFFAKYFHILFRSFAILLTIWISLFTGLSIAYANGEEVERRTILVERVSFSLQVQFTATHCTFDALNRKLTETSLTSTGTIISAFDYSQPQGTDPSGYDDVGNVLKIVEQYGHTSVNDRTITNVYDHTYRLEQETRSTGVPPVTPTTTVTQYSYDKANNRTQKSVTIDSGTPTDTTYTQGTHAEGYNSNQIKSVTEGGTTTTFEYDPNGNRIEKKFDGTTVQTYSYDHENRLTDVTDPSGNYHYAYDHRTRRVLREEPVGVSGSQPASSAISFSGGLSVQEYDTTQSSPYLEYIRGSDYGGGIGGVLYTIRSGARSYNTYNSRGDVISQTDDTQAITYQAAYEAFGTRTQEEGSTLDRQKANTKDEDPTGLLNEGMRYRDLEFGIFLTRDPLGHVDGPNEYTYVRQNPWTYYDPYGLSLKSWVVEGTKANWQRTKNATATAVSGLGKAANETIHGVAQAGVIVEIAAKKGAKGVGIDVDVDAAYDRLEKITKHKNSYEKEIQSAQEEVLDAEVNENGEIGVQIFAPSVAGKVNAARTLAGKADEAFELGGKTARELAEKTGKSSRAARRKAMRETGTPTSRPATSQAGHKGHRQYTTEGADGKPRVQTQHPADKDHAQPHWHDSAPKNDPNTGQVLKNRHGQIKYKKEKSSTSTYDE